MTDEEIAVFICNRYTKEEIEKIILNLQKLFDEQDDFEEAMAYGEDEDIMIEAYEKKITLDDLERQGNFR